MLRHSHAGGHECGHAHANASAYSARLGTRMYKVMHTVIPDSAIELYPPTLLQLYTCLP